MAGHRSEIDLKAPIRFSRGLAWTFAAHNCSSRPSRSSDQYLVKEENDRSGRREGPKGSPEYSLKRRLGRGGAESHKGGGLRHRDGRPSRAEGQHRAGASKHSLSGPRRA